MIRRDEMVFEYARDKKVPLVMALSGGYQVLGLGVVLNCSTHEIVQQMMISPLFFVEIQRGSYRQLDKEFEAQGIF